jgi:ribonuclease HI
MELQKEILGPTGFGAILRNSNGEILHLAAGYLGFNTNNVVELWSLLRGIKIATYHHYNKIIVEGDSQIIVQLITKILHGEHPWKSHPVGDSLDSWRTLAPSYGPTSPSSPLM